MSFKLYRTLRMAFQALVRNIMRSALTTLGIVIGVAAVIAMVEIGQGSKSAIARTIQSMGANNLLIMPGAASSGGVSFGSGSVMTLTPGDVEAIARECRPAVEYVAPLVRARTQVIYSNKNWVPIYIYGTTPAYLDVREWDLETGRMFTDQEVNGANEVCVLGQTVVRELFGEEIPLGKVIRVNNYPLKIVGTLTRKGANTFGMDQDDIVMAPWRTIKFKVAGQSAATANQSAPSADASSQTNAAISDASNRYPGQALPLYPAKSASQLQDFPSPLLPTNIDQIQVKAESEQEIKQAIRQITALLHERHKIRPGHADDFNIRDMSEVTKAMGSTSELMSSLLLSVALISLLVGGVGIMNIMLVSVTERTKEIGLRMAVGARARDILRQFLVEAILLCLLGGLVGIVAGMVGSWLVTLIKGWPTERSIPAIIASVGVSAAVGIIFGYYPAWKASRLDPIEALRYE
jgi:ABC-type antimicrobial peptide transport system permease subunit